MIETTHGIKAFILTGSFKEFEMKKSLALALIVVATTAGAANADAAKVVDGAKAGAKKVGLAIVWPFKKVGQGMKAVGKKVTGK
jgi:hypothetical protein